MNTLPEAIAPEKQIISPCFRRKQNNFPFLLTLSRILGFWSEKWKSGRLPPGKITAVKSKQINKQKTNKSLLIRFIVTFASAIQSFSLVEMNFNKMLKIGYIA